MSRNRGTKLKAPFLKRVYLHENCNLDQKQDVYPYSLPIVSRKHLNLELKHPITIIVGENGTGKSTILEAIATGCNFNINGGNANHLFGEKRKSQLANDLRFSWLPKVSKGFFMRAESFYNFASHIDTLAVDDASIHDAYGGTSLHHKSHGESFLSLFKNQFQHSGIYILDEPEAALSPNRQLAFLRILQEMERANSQVIIATHSPIIMAYPNAQLLEISENGFSQVLLEDTEHFSTTAAFYDNPQRFVQYILAD